MLRVKNLDEMKKLFTFLTLFFLLITCLSSPVYAAGKKGILLTTTAEISQDYEVIDIVYARSGTTSLGDLNDELKRRAVRMGADAVIGIRYLPFVGYLYAYGTAVKFKE